MSALTCKDFDERLLDYLYDELGVDEDQAIAAHLATCARCMMEVQAFRRVRQAARSLPIAEPSLSVSTRLLEAAAAAHGASASAMGELSIASPPALRVVPPPARSSSPVLGSSLPAAALSPPAAAKSAAPAAPRRRRGFLGTLLHPGFAAAASFVVVGMGAAWFLTYQRDAMIAPGVSASSPAPSKAEPATVDRPSDVVAEKNAPTLPSPAAMAEPVPTPKSVAALPDKNLEDKKLDVKENAEHLAAAKDVAASDRMAAEGGTVKMKAEAPALAHAGAARHHAAGGDDSLDTLIGAGGPGGTRGAAMAPPVAARPGPRTESAAAPANGRQPSGDGRWLAQGENKELARSVGGAPAAVAPATAMNSMEAQKEDRRVDQRQQKRAAAPAEDPTSDSASDSMQRRTDEPERTAAGKRAQQQQAVVERDRSREEESPKKKASRGYEGSGSAIGQVEAAPASPVAAPPPPPRPSAAPSQAPPAMASAAVSGPHDLQRLIAEFRGDLLLNNCEGAVERYLAIGAQHAGHGFAAQERLGVARCLVHLRRFDEARVELRSIRDQVPGARAQVDHELASLDQKEAVLARRQAAPPAAKAARPQSRKKAAGPSSAKTLDADTAPAAY